MIRSHWTAVSVARKLPGRWKRFATCAAPSLLVQTCAGLGPTHPYNHDPYCLSSEFWMIRSVSRARDDLVLRKVLFIYFSQVENDALNGFSWHFSFRRLVAIWWLELVSGQTQSRFISPGPTQEKWSAVPPAVARSEARERHPPSDPRRVVWNRSRRLNEALLSSQKMWTTAL